jgi:hypothetical protein
VAYKYTWVYFSSFAPDTLDSIYLGPEDSPEECICIYNYRALKPEGCEGWNPHCLRGLCPRDLRISPGGLRLTSLTSLVRMVRVFRGVR